MIRKESRNMACFEDKMQVLVLKTNPKGSDKISEGLMHTLKLRKLSLDRKGIHRFYKKVQVLLQWKSIPHDACIRTV